MVTFKLEVGESCEASMLDYNSPLVSVHLTLNGSERRFRLDLGKRIAIDRFEGEDVIVPPLLDMVSAFVRAKRIALLKGTPDP